MSLGIANEGQFADTRDVMKYSGLVLVSLFLCMGVAACGGDDDAPSETGGDNSSGDGDGDGDDSLDPVGDGDGDSDDGMSGDGDESSDECKIGGGEAPVGACIVAAFAGTYEVVATTGEHARGTVILGADGSVDYDTDLSFVEADYDGIYDRLECCQRISVEMLQTSENDTSIDADARRRVDIFTSDATTSGDVQSFEYYPNWPGEGGKVVLEVQ